MLLILIIKKEILTVLNLFQNILITHFKIIRLEFKMQKKKIYNFNYNKKIQKKIRLQINRKIDFISIIN
jgi:hypothetical protein